MKQLLLFLLFVYTLHASILISPVESMRFAFGKGIALEKRNILLTKQQAHEIQKLAKTRLSTKIYQIYKASKGEQVLGYGILISKKVRSKNCVVMYHVAYDGNLKSIEIIAFNEPGEYLPNKEWLHLFNDTPTSSQLYLTQQIPTITGATLSARSITDASRIAFAIYNVILKGGQ